MTNDWSHEEERMYCLDCEAEPGCNIDCPRCREYARRDDDAGAE